MSLAFIMTASSAAFADVNGGSGTIHFTGTVIDAPCSIAPESIEQTVELGSVALSSLKTAGSHSRPATGEIKLVDCTLTSVEGDETTTYSKVGVTFSGTRMQPLLHCWQTIPALRVLVFVSWTKMVKLLNWVLKLNIH